jgi:hypothetical protein
MAEVREKMSLGFIKKMKMEQARVHPMGAKNSKKLIASFIARTSSKRQHKPPRGFGQLQNFQREFSINRFLPFPSPSFKAG